LRRLDLLLGNSYEQLGRADEARRALQSAFDAYVASEPPEHQTRMAATERWARFLVGHGNIDTAQRLFSEVLAQDHDRHLAHAALAQAGLARVALARGQANDALTASAAAMTRCAEVRGFRDVRMGAYIARVHARAQLAAGDRQGARATAEAALAESLRYDAPEAASIAEARALIAQAR
jgi:serine/threonine-protein kinase